VFLRLGSTAFGGPAAHTALLHQELVVQRQSLSEEQFLDLVSAANLIPGPNSTELVIHIGLQRAGYAGMLVAGLCFIAPAMFSVLALAAAYVRFGSLPAALALLARQMQCFPGAETPAPAQAGLRAAVRSRAAGAVVRHAALVSGKQQRRRNQKVSRGTVAGHGYVPNHRHAQQRLYVRVMRLRLQRVPKENQQIHGTLGNAGANLHVPAQRAAEQAGDGQLQLALQHAPGGASGQQHIVLQHAKVKGSPLHQI